MADVESDTLCWTKKTITPRCIYAEDVWPRIVKAAGGHYGAVSHDTYSVGDVMVILGPRSFPRIVAQKYRKPDNDLPITATPQKQGPPNYSIPLNLSGKGDKLCMVQILPFRPSEYVYKTAQDLLETFPRYVKVNRSLSIHPRLPLVNKGSILELLQTDLRMEADVNGPSKFLICGYDDRRIPLKMDTWGDFTVDDDPGHYTLKELVERFPLPQRIHFTVMPKGLKTNDIVLLDEATYDILIAVPLSVIGKEVSHKDFDVMFFPLSSEADFYDCTSNEDSDVYQKIQGASNMFGLKNFKDMNVVGKEAAMSEICFNPYQQVYQNFAGSGPPLLPRVRKPKPTPGRFRTPPDLPSTSTGAGYVPPEGDNNNSVPHYDEAGNWTGKKSLPPECPGLPPKPKAATMPALHLVVNPLRAPNSTKERFDNVKKTVVGKFGVLKKILKGSNLEGQGVSAVLVNQRTYSGQDEARDSGSDSSSDPDAYDYPKLASWTGSGDPNYANHPPPFQPIPQKVVSKMFGEARPVKKKPLKNSNSCRKDMLLKSDKSHDRILDLSKLSLVSDNNSSTVIYNEEKPASISKRFSEYSVAQIADLVRASGLQRIATVMEENKVDGDFFKSLKSDMLAGVPFHASSFEIEALKRIQKGKIPKGVIL